MRKKVRTLVPILAVAMAVLVSHDGSAQGPGPVVSGLGPLFKPLTIDDAEEILLPEASAALNAGRIVIVDRNGRVRPLISGLPSGPAAPGGDPSGPTALHLIGNRLYIAIGAGNSAISGPVPGSEIPNPAVASPLFSSILSFEVDVLGTEGGFVLTPADQALIAQGQEVRLTNARGERPAIRLVVDFPNFLPDPLPTVPTNGDPCNPYSITGSDSQLDIADAGCNMIRRVDVYRGTSRVIATFPQQRNTLFPGMGGPFVDAVPTGVHGLGSELIVSLLTGFPFGPGAASILSVSPETGAVTTVISGLRMVTDVLARRNGPATTYWVLEFGAGGPGRILRFDTATSNPIVITNSLTAPTGMSWDSHGGNIIVSQLTGTLVRVAP